MTRGKRAARIKGIFSKDLHLDEFYSEAQKRRETVEQQEQEIFEHLARHTKNVLKRQKH